MTTAARRRPTSADVAERAGVSRATVSMVLNGRTEGTVSEANQRRVLEAAAELGYTRSAVAMSLRERRTRTIGLISDEIATSPWAGRMVRAANQAAAERGYMVLAADLSRREATIEARCGCSPSGRSTGSSTARWAAPVSRCPSSRRTCRWCS
ncbi:LacI family DNA-binding transcriptional regulator [Brachybacterium aquaticum]|uniref:DNA-binding LacI/PurR family transcriptional regulator n=1 Tax=Brachybacterium aquaticum TaxID=1432564 RepID=A0A841AGW7_9MICO|nr:LacI family DNA-binding transcriptional regulator [Brachybacterium aquaticum]MBB5832530.1 DNA-binding LacI/PurR family transcriptional regulator [Brachybacterium aquaticum]